MTLTSGDDARTNVIMPPRPTYEVKWPTKKEDFPIVSSEQYFFCIRNAHSDNLKNKEWIGIYDIPDTKTNVSLSIPPSNDFYKIISSVSV